MPPPPPPSSSTNCCRSLLAFHLKLLNFFQTFIGVSIIIYSVWMLNRWNKQSQILPPPSAPSPQSSSSSPAGLQLLNSQNFEFSRAQFDYNHPLAAAAAAAAAGIVSGMDDDDNNNNAIQFQLTKLPTPWFIYFMMGIGILLCSVTCIGHIASEAINGCCLCFYSLLTIVLILLEAAIVAFLIFDKRWEKDLPNDATGELESLRSFIENNMDICKWLGIAVVIIQAFSLLLALILRGLVSTRNSEYDSDDDYAIIRDRSGQPLLNPQLSQASGSTSTDSKANHSDIWSNRMRNKYGFHSGDVKYNLGDTNTSMVSTSNEDQRRCSIL